MICDLSSCFCVVASVIGWAGWEVNMTHTHADILRMTPAEVREAIAREKGYKCKHGYLDEACINPKDYWVTPAGRLTSVLPNWPVSIADAWELVTEMVNAPGICNVQEKYRAGSHYAECYFREYPTNSAKLILGHADTAPLAISRCWLEWFHKENA